MAEGHTGDLGALRYQDLTGLMRGVTAQHGERLAAVRRDLSGARGQLSDRDRSLIAGMLRRLADDAIVAVVAALRTNADPAATVLAERVSGIERARVHAALSAAGVLHADGLLEAALARVAEARIEAAVRRPRNDYVVLRSRRLDEYGNPRIPLTELPREAAQTLVWSAAAAIRVALVHGDDAQSCDDVLERAAARAVQVEGPFDGAAVVETARRIAPAHVDAAVHDSDPMVCAALIANAAQLSLAQVRRVLYGVDALPLALLGRHIGMTRAGFAALAQFVGAGPQALPAFDRTAAADAAKLVREWTRAPDYRAALDRIGAARAC
jgi:hypothetical protein